VLAHVVSLSLGLRDANGFAFDDDAGFLQKAYAFEVAVKPGHVFDVSVMPGSTNAPPIRHASASKRVKDY
jgi:hypothetical protein